MRTSEVTGPQGTPMASASEHRPANKTVLNDVNYAEMSSPSGCSRPPTLTLSDCDGSEVTGPEGTTLDTAPGSPTPSQQSLASHLIADPEHSNIDVTGEFFRCENNDEQSQGQIDLAMILNEVTGLFSYGERKINIQENVETIADNDDVTPMGGGVFGVDDAGDGSLEELEYDITQCPKRSKRKNLTKLGSEENHLLKSSQTLNLRARKRKAKEPDQVWEGIKVLGRKLPKSVSKSQPGNKKLKVNGLECPQCDYTTNIDGVHIKIMYNCNECEYTTYWKTHLKMHIDGVHNKILYNCNECAYTTTWKGNLKKHIDVVHNKILYNCKECAYTTIWKSNLNRHIDGKCDDYDYKTNRKDKLRSHNCNECTYTTMWKSNLNRHIDGVHKNVLHKCHDCDYTTNRKQNLRSHIDVVHKKTFYNCNECTYTTSWKSNL